MRHCDFLAGYQVGPDNTFNLFMQGNMTHPEGLGRHPERPDFFAIKEEFKDFETMDDFYRKQVVLLFYASDVDTLLNSKSQWTSDPIVLATIAKLNDRSKVGVNKYGTTLAQNNTDNFLVHLQQELLDGANYIEKLIQDDEH